MKSALACILVVHVLLTSLTPAGLVEAVRLPALSEHFAQHLLESDGSMSWTSFLFLHYADPAHERTDGKRHEHLPFHNTPSLSVLFTVDQTPLFVAVPAEPQRTYGSLPTLGAGILSGPIVFHPPKAIG